MTPLPYSPPIRNPAFVTSGNTRTATARFASVAASGFSASRLLSAACALACNSGCPCAAAGAAVAASHSAPANAQTHVRTKARQTLPRTLAEKSANTARAAPDRQLDLTCIATVSGIPTVRVFILNSDSLGLKVNTRGLPYAFPVQPSLACISGKRIDLEPDLVGPKGSSADDHFATTSAGGCQVPSPAGRMDGGVSLGQ